MQTGWFRLCPGSSDEIVFTVSANESTSSREATITVTSEDGSLVRTVQVVQKGEAVYLDVSPSNISDGRGRKIHFYR